MSESNWGIREGEVAVELPERFDASLYFIGRNPLDGSRKLSEECAGIGRDMHHRG
jgi:hypothetical protein